MGLSGGIPLGIAYSEISQYAKDHDLEVDEAVSLIGGMDQLFIQHHAERSK